MANWLSIVILLLVLGVVAFVASAKRNATAEGFGEFKTSQMDFANYQNTYFHDKINKGILTNPGLNLNGLNDAAAQPDLYLPKSPKDDMTRFFMEDPENAFTEEDNTMCRGATHPRFLPVRKPGDRIGCGWYFKESPDAMSLGALGTRDGPVIPTGLKGGMWIWNREEAIKLEDMKRCKALSNCEMLELGDISRECGFCQEKGHGIPINSNGSPKYPEDAAGNCGSTIVTKADDCYPPEEETETDENGVVVARAPVREGAAGSRWCINNGIVSVPCLLNSLQWYGYNPARGGLGKLISGSAPDAMTRSALSKLAESGLALPEAFWKRRDRTTVSQATGVIAGISNKARRLDGTNESRAARFLVDGTPYSPCESYTGDKRGPFDVECLQQAFRKAGCQAGGAAYPSQRTAVSEMANVTWSQANAMFKKTYDNMKSADPRTQDMALKNCLGVGAEFSRDVGETCWKCEDGIHAPIRRNATGDIECASTDGYNCLWQANKAGCDAVIANMPPLRPLKCGADHKAKYGGDGYSSPSHWCARASAGGKHDGPLAKK